jgi:hypothetical protein
MQRIKQLIAARNQKIKQMQENFEPSARITQYKQASLNEIKQTYLKTVQELREANKN